MNSAFTVRVSDLQLKHYADIDTEQPNNVESTVFDRGNALQVAAMIDDVLTVLKRNKVPANIKELEIYIEASLPVPLQSAEQASEWLVKRLTLQDCFHDFLMSKKKELDDNAAANKKADVEVDKILKKILS